MTTENMPMTLWREKLLASAIHFGVTLLLAGIAAAVIFLVWYPDPFQTMIGGTELFLLIVGSDLALGPLMSLVIYNSRKSRRELLLDYSVVGIVQVAALVYGVGIMADARPVYVAFNHDRLEIVLAGDLREAELAAARKPEYSRVPWTGPRYIAVHVPPEDKNDALFQAVAGNETHMRPKFFVPFDAKRKEILEKAKPLAELERKKPDAVAQLREVVASLDVPPERLEWLPVRHFRGFWTVLIDTTTGRPVTYMDLDPY
jgi:hypothetical protein